MIYLHKSFGIASSLGLTRFPTGRINLKLIKLSTKNFDSTFKIISIPVHVLH